MITNWSELHRKARFLPKYPNEDVVRFIFTHFPNPGQRARTRILDLGCGGGRHTKLLTMEGFCAYGADFSITGLQHAARTINKNHQSAKFITSDMHYLPFRDDTFEGLIAFGSLYYTDWQGMRKSVKEVHRVLKHEGKAFIQVRAKHDSRFNQGVQIDNNTFRLTTDNTNEQGMLNCFLDEQDVRELFKDFQHITLDLNEFTLDDRRIKNSDWIIVVTK